MEIYIDDVTMARLERAAKHLDRSVYDLARCAIEETALDWARSRGFEGEHDDKVD